MKKQIILGLMLLFISAAHSQKINQFDTHGKRHGKWMKKYEGTNQIRYRGEFEHGQEVGTFEFYKPPKEDVDKENPKTETHPFATKTYSKGSNLVQVKYFTEKGNLLSKGKMKNKKRFGKWVYFHPDTDEIMMTEFYENGKLNGLQTTYYENGKINKKANYQNGKLDGKKLIYWKNGQLLKYFTYENGELNGLVKYYDASGNLIAKGMYKDNRKDGIWKTYKNGKVVKTEEFPKYN